MRTKYMLGCVVAALVIVVAGFFAFNAYIYQQKQSGEEVPEPYRATLTGEYLCLPHTEPGDFHTMECAFGLKTNAGEYFAIDFQFMSQMAPDDLSVGSRISATGLVTPVEYLSSNRWQQYPIKGIFSVTDSVQVLE